MPTQIHCLSGIIVIYTVRLRVSAIQIIIILKFIGILYHPVFIGKKNMHKKSIILKHALEVSVTGTAFLDSKWGKLSVV